MLSELLKTILSEYRALREAIREGKRAYRQQRKTPVVNKTRKW